MMWKSNDQASDETEDKTAPNSENQEAVESVAPVMDPLTQLQADLKSAKAEAAEWQDRFLRKAAEFENYRKRMEKEKTELVNLAKGSVLMEFLPLADDCERALRSLGEAEEETKSLRRYREGVELLYRQLMDILSRTGVTPLEVEGKPFDPHFHDALSRQESADCKEDTVIHELRRGYMFKEKLLRPAQVIVAVRPKTKDKESQ
jgi:molecular chaperone GrpE